MFSAFGSAKNGAAVEQIKAIFFMTGLYKFSPDVILSF